MLKLSLKKKKKTYLFFSLLFNVKLHSSVYTQHYFIDYTCRILVNLMKKKQVQCIACIKSQGHMLKDDQCVSISFLCVMIKFSN